MDKQQWKQMDDILQQAFDLPTTERAAFLDQACNDNQALRNEVESMLNADREMGEFLNQPLLGHKAEPSAIGRRVGAYRIERLIGRGGMGAVYLAIRDDDQKFHQQAAIKLIKRGMDTDEIIERFRYERRILASLNHPNIARLLDGGTTEDGLPYFVMEYIQGQPLLDYCQQKNLSIPDRLKLFLQVCAAVQHAHNNLIVHRDLKPSNILVTPSTKEKDGSVKLLDFGIAKLLDADETGLSTLLGQRPMTPEYASPEQIRGETITTASDVYSLGVVLYELLTGKRPYQFQQHNTEEIANQIRVHDPLPPSKSDSSLKLNKLPRQLRVDLDNIALKAIHKELDHRYQSVAQLAEDIERYLSGKTVAARPQSFAYSAMKFVRRHRAAVATSTLILCLIATSVIAYTVQAAKTANESKKADQVSEFLVNMISSAAPESSKGEKLTVREVLDIGSKRIERELQSQPEIQANLMNTIGEVYLSLALYPQAAAIHKQALEIRQRLFGRRHSATAESLVNYARSVAHINTPREELEKMFLEALAIQRATLGENHPEVAATICDLAGMLGRDRGEVELLYRQALDIQRRSLGNISLEVSKTLSALSAALSGANQREAAETLAREALGINEQLFSKDDWRLASSKQSLANILHERGKYTEAEPLMQETLSIFRATWPNGHQATGNSLYWLGRNQMKLGRIQEAESSFRESYEIKRKLLPADNFELISAQWILGVALSAENRFEEAEPLLKLGFSTLYNKLPFNDWAARQSHWELQSLYAAWGKPEKLNEHLAAYEQVIRKALDKRAQQFGENHLQVGEAKHYLAEALLGQGKLQEAETTARQAQAIAEKQMPGMPGSTILIGLVLHKRGRLAEAEKLLRTGLELTRQRIPEEHLSPALGEIELSKLLINQRKYDEAEQLLTDALRLLVPLFYERDFRSQETIRQLVTLYRAWGKPEKVVEYQARLTRP